MLELLSNLQCNEAIGNGCSWDEVLHGFASQNRVNTVLTLLVRILNHNYPQYLHNNNLEMNTNKNIFDLLLSEICQFLSSWMR